MQSYVRMAAVTPSATILACGPHSADHRHPRPIDQRGGPGAAEQQWGSTAKTNTEVQTPPPSAIENTAGLGGGGRNLAPGAASSGCQSCSCVMLRSGETRGDPNPTAVSAGRGRELGGTEVQSWGPTWDPQPAAGLEPPQLQGGQGLGGQS